MDSRESHNLVLEVKELLDVGPHPVRQYRAVDLANIHLLMEVDREGDQEILLLEGVGKFDQGSSLNALHGELLCLV